MNLLRRSLLTIAGAALLGGAGSSLAQTRPRIDVVKVMSFSCNFCLQAEAHDKRIAQEVQGAGGKFVWAPVPSMSEDTGNKERVYYAARDLDPALGETVKRAFYKGQQDQGVPLFEYAEIYVWLQGQLPGQEQLIVNMFSRAQGEEGTGAFRRAVNLARNAQVTQLPTYIVLKNGYIEKVLDISSAPSNNLASLRDTVISTVQELNSKP